MIATLERLKSEASEVARKAAETNVVMAEVEQVSAQYAKLAHSCSLIYLTLYHLHEVRFLYRYSLEFLLEIFTAVLHSPDLETVKEPAQRLQVITKNLFEVSAFWLGSTHLLILFRFPTAASLKECSTTTSACSLCFCCAST